MKTFWDIMASLIEMVANFGAGAASNGLGYEPKLPEKLMR